MKASLGTRTTTNDWINKIRKGDVLKSPSGLLRVVRQVSHTPSRKPGYINTSVHFTIRHCSWTHRHYTVYTGNDLVQTGYLPAGTRVALRSKADREIEAGFGLVPSVMTCCAVRGIA